MNTAASEVTSSTGAGGGSNNNTGVPSLQTEDEYEQLKRFQIELEFVQCLSNPWYLHSKCHSQHSTATIACVMSHCQVMEHLTDTLFCGIVGK